MSEHEVCDLTDRFYLDLKGARERLCRAQTELNPADSGILQGAIDRIDLVACDLPQWSRHDGGRAS
jgi:pyruvate-formate lyase-activating enzyme